MDIPRKYTVLHFPVGTLGGENYALPLWDAQGVPADFGIDPMTWTFVGVLPAGLEVTDLQHVNGHKYSCKIVGKMPAYVASWSVRVW